MKSQKKNFFRRPTATEILSRTNNREVHEDFWENLLALKDDESITLVGKLYKGTESEFFKRGPVLELPTFYAKQPTLLPYQLRKKVFDALKERPIKHFRGATFAPSSEMKEYIDSHFEDSQKPIIKDFTPRLVRLNDLLEGARIYGYAPFSIEPRPFTASTQIEEYGSINKETARDPNVQGVAKDGATIIITSPSRIKGARKYRVILHNIPIADNDYKYFIAPTIWAEHMCEDKDHTIKYSTKKDSAHVPEYRFCEHIIAAEFAVMDFYKNMNINFPGERHNIIPLRMNMIGIPTPLMCEIYDKLLHKTLIKDNLQSKPRVPLEADVECVLWEGPHKEGYDKCLYYLDKMNLKDFPWTIYDGEEFVKRQIK